MIENSRNLCLYPNVYLMDQFSSQIRVARPISVNKTEITIYCIAPKGESAEARAKRIRQYEDFFNVSGMATPDDLEEFRSCQTGYGAGTGWNDMSRGATHWWRAPTRRPKKSNSSRCSRACAPRMKACSCCSTSIGRTPCSRHWSRNSD